MRYSYQRNKILEIVRNSNDHPTAKTIYLRCKKEISNISLGTVYRNLNALVLNKEVKKIEIPSDIDRFDKTLYNHYHFYCNNCKQVYDIELKNIKNINKIIENDTNYIVNGINILVDGICHNCKKEN